MHCSKGIASKRVRIQILERSEYACQMCGAAGGDADEYNPGQQIRVHVRRIISRSQGGRDEPSNLRTLCSMCDRGVRDMVKEPPLSWTSLLADLSRANLDDQQQVLEWLRRKFRTGK